MHACKNVDVYLSCASRPIVEDVSGVRVAPVEGLLDGHLNENGNEGKNFWDQVDDFKWLRSDVPSPNWGVVPEGERLTRDALEGWIGKVRDGAEKQGGKVDVTLLQWGLPVKLDKVEDTEEEI